MVKFHNVVFILGCILTAVGTLIGLPVLMMGYQNIGKFMIMFAPIGMIMMFAALVVITLHPSQTRSKENIHPQQGKMPD